MTDEELERELRAWYGAEIDGLVAPVDLRDDVRAIPSMLPFRAAGAGRRPLVLLIAAAIATTAIIGSAIVGSGVLRPAPIAPAPSDAALLVPSPEPVASTLVVPSDTPTSEPAPVLGGGAILAVLPHPGARHCNTTDAPYDVVKVDPASGSSTVLGTTASDCAVRPFDVRWAADRTKMVLLDRDRPKQLDLSTLTDAGRALPVVCCHLPSYLSVWQDGGGSGQGWTVSPHGDRIAAVHTRRPDVGDAIIVSDIDGQNVRRLALPDGADARVGGIAWSPDESTIAITGCRPCNTAERGQPANAVERWQLYLVPVNGSALRVLISSAPGQTIAQPAWAPDGSSIAVIVDQCARGQTPPHCTNQVASNLATVDVASGTLGTIVSGPDLGQDLDIVDPSWAPDGQRIRFEVIANMENSDNGVTTDVVDRDGTHLATVVAAAVSAWSPDGQWFLVGPDPSKAMVSIGSIDGGPLRELGAFTAVDW